MESQNITIIIIIDIIIIIIQLIDHTVYRYTITVSHSDKLNLFVRCEIKDLDKESLTL